MRKNFGPKTYLYPQPVLIIATYDKDGNPNVMNAAWGGIAEEDEIMVCLGKHKTTDNLAITNECTISVGTKDTAVACDYVGIVSASKEPDKFKKSGFTTVKSEFVNAPIINELPLTFECKLDKIVDDCKYFFKIVNVSCDEKYLGENGNPSSELIHPITFDACQMGYVELGNRVANAFKDGLKLK